MKEILEKQLFDDFPLLYEKATDIRSSCMAFGFECGDGWYELIRELSEKLCPLVEKAKRKLSDEFEFEPKASQVKEKYGELRFYMDYATDEMFDLICEYEDRSGKICEVCGKPGGIDYTQKWLSARCEEHRKA